MNQTNQCPHCDHGKVLCHTSRVNLKHGIRTRYFRCDKCSYAPPKQVLALELAPVSKGRVGSWSQRKEEGAKACPTS